MRQSKTSKKESAVLADSNQARIRIITAIIGIPILIAFLFAGKTFFLLAVLFIMALCVAEFISLLKAKNLLKSAIVIPGLIYINLLLSLYAILSFKEGRLLVLFTFFGTWVFDTAAYYAGSKWGAHKIIPKISAKKSLEGLLAGIAAVSVVALFFAGSIMMPWVKLAWIFTISVSAFLGDVNESYFKRRLGVKDSSGWLPGHGGFLDRFDSLILTSISSYLLFRWFL